MLYFKSLIMGAERMKILKHDFSLKCLWGILGFILIGGIYFLSLADVDEVVVKESKNFFEYVRAVLK